MRTRISLALVGTLLLGLVAFAGPAMASPDRALICHFPDHVGDYQITGDPASCRGRVLSLPSKAAGAHLEAAGTDPTDDSGGDGCEPTDTGVIFLGTIRGDTGSDQITRAGELCPGERDSFRFHLREDDFSLSPNDLTARITVSGGPGDIDLCVYRDSSFQNGSCSRSGGAYVTELVGVSVTDTFGTDDSSDLYVEVIHWSGPASQYTLVIQGNV
jgi:hypothetical protein